MSVQYSVKDNRLVWLESKASPEFWDSQWDSAWSDIKKINNSFFVNKTKQYLPLNSRVLEGGCGMGDKVYALSKAGFEAVGLDFAEETVKKIKEEYPELSVELGDVRNLTFADNSFDGYWSLGVIEHFFDGYDHISSEMVRVINNNGYLFLTVPSISPLRKLKIKMGKYEEFVPREDNIKNFYQFALSEKEVVEHFTSKGFVLKELSRLDGTKGLQDESSLLKPLMKMLRSGKSFPTKATKKILDILLRHWTNHITLFVFQKN